LYFEISGSNKYSLGEQKGLFKYFQTFYWYCVCCMCRLYIGLIRLITIIIMYVETHDNELSQNDLTFEI